MRQLSPPLSRKWKRKTSKMQFAMETVFFEIRFWVIPVRLELLWLSLSILIDSDLTNYGMAKHDALQRVYFLDFLSTSSQISSSTCFSFFITDEDKPIKIVHITCQHMQTNSLNPASPSLFFHTPRITVYIPSDRVSRRVWHGQFRKSKL